LGVLVVLTWSQASLFHAEAKPFERIRTNNKLGFSVNSSALSIARQGHSWAMSEATWAEALPVCSARRLFYAWPCFFLSFWKRGSGGKWNQVYSEHAKEMGSFDVFLMYYFGCFAYNDSGGSCVYSCNSCSVRPAANNGTETLLCIACPFEHFTACHLALGIWCLRYVCLGMLQCNTI
jgi:hypothetical protein